MKIHSTPITREERLLGFNKLIPPRNCTDIFMRKNYGLQF